MVEIHEFRRVTKIECNTEFGQYTCQFSSFYTDVEGQQRTKVETFKNIEGAIIAQPNFKMHPKPISLDAEPGKLKSFMFEPQSGNWLLHCLLIELEGSTPSKPQFELDCQNEGEEW